MGLMELLVVVKEIGHNDLKTLRVDADGFEDVEDVKAKIEIGTNFRVLSIEEITE